jgi:hypothetical protein
MTAARRAWAAFLDGLQPALDAARDLGGPRTWWRRAQLRVRRVKWRAQLNVVRRVIQRGLEHGRRDE